MKSPRRTLHKITWYFCLAVLLFSIFPVSAYSQEPADAPVHVHKRHNAAGHRLHPARRLGIKALPVAAWRSDSVNVPYDNTEKPVGLSDTEAASHYKAEKKADSAALAAPAKLKVAAKTVHLKKTIAPVNTLVVLPAKAEAKVVEAPAIKKAAPKTKILAPLQMTRDAVSSPFGSTGSRSLQDAGSMNVTYQIVRMLAATLFVLLMALGVVKLIKRFNLVPESSKNAGVVEPAETLPVGPLSTLMANMDTSEHGLGALAGREPSFQLLSSLSLPGSTATIHLVRVTGKTLVISSTPSGETAMLTEVSIVPPAEVHNAEPVTINTETLLRNGDGVTAFAEILKERSESPARADLRSLNQVDMRLTATQERLNARLKAGADLETAVTAVTPTPSRRRTARTAKPKVTEV
jgi:flagellar biogenesis protein FliO